MGPKSCWFISHTEVNSNQAIWNNIIGMINRKEFRNLWREDWFEVFFHCHYRSQETTRKWNFLCPWIYCPKQKLVSGPCEPGSLLNFIWSGSLLKFIWSLAILYEGFKFFGQTKNAIKLDPKIYNFIFFILLNLCEINHDFLGI